jgi:hypothetical protein
VANGVETPNAVVLFVLLVFSAQFAALGRHLPAITTTLQDDLRATPARPTGRRA